LHHVRQFQHLELLGELIEHAALAGLGRIQAGQFDATHGVANIQIAARLSALAVHGQRISHGGLHAEPVQHRAENFVVIEAVDQRLVERHFVGHGAVDHALIQVGGAQPPDPAAEHDVVAVMHLGEVIERAGLLGERQHVARPLCSMLM
jgi:hypothetical protein